MTLRTRLAASLLAVLVAVVPGPSVGPGDGSSRAAGPPLRYLAGPAGTLDPAYITAASDVQLQLQLYAGLTRLDETGAAYPSLASGWDISDDGLTYTFALREGLTFSDGSPLVAEDVRRSWLRLFDPATRATAPDVLTVVAGAAERLAGEADESDVGIEAPNETTLIVHLRHPASYFLDIVATPTTFVVPRTADATPTWQSADAFVGSGPYVVDGLDGPDLVLRANERYVAGPPPINEIRWLAGVDADGASAFAAGDADLVGVPGWDATWIAFDGELGPRLHRAEPLTISYFGFDTTRPPFDDPDVRRAFALALDRERLVGLAEGASSQPAASLVPPAIWPDGFLPEMEADLDEARRLLDEAGYEDRRDLGTVVVNGTGLGVEPAVAVWREELGVDIAIENMSFIDFLAVLDNAPPHIFTINWIADYASPHALYGLLLETGALSNWGGWSDPEFDALLEAAAAAPVDEIGAAYDAVEARVHDQAPVIPWSYGETWWLVADGLRGLGNLTIGLMDFGRVSWDG
jgi:oligopeptide transport system substrate-binding protein